MDKVFSYLKEKGFSLKYEKTSEWVAQDDNLDSDSSTSTTFSDRTIFLCDPQPWYTPDEIQERIEAIIGQEIRMSTTQYNVGDPDKNAWRIRGGNLRGWAGSYLKENNGKYLGQIVGYADYMGAKTDHEKQWQSYSSMAASATKAP